MSDQPGLKWEPYPLPFFTLGGEERKPRVLNPTPPLVWKDGPILGTFATHLTRRDDHRGWLLEAFRDDELPIGHVMGAPLMAYLSSTAPGVLRGPHEHAAQTDVFVFAWDRMEVFLWDNRPESKTYGNRAKFEGSYRDPIRVVVPPGVVHAYRNMGTHDAVVFNAPDRLFAGPGRREPVDEVRHELNQHTVFVPW